MVRINLARGRARALGDRRRLLTVFAVFIGVTLADMTRPARIQRLPGGRVVASVALTFFAYLGFNVITVTAGDLSDRSATSAGEYRLSAITAVDYV